MVGSLSYLPYFKGTVITEFFITTVIPSGSAIHLHFVLPLILNARDITYSTSCERFHVYTAFIFPQQATLYVGWDSNLKDVHTSTTSGLNEAMNHKPHHLLM